jgi:Hydantoin racemase
MKKIAILHTVRSVADSFDKLVREKITEPLSIVNLLDESLLATALEMGCFTSEGRQKLYLDLLSASLDKPDAIVVTCSSLSPHVRALRPSFNIPLITIDERMFLNAAAAGTVIGVMATAATTVESTVAGIRDAAGKAGKSIEIRTVLDEEAMALLQNGDVSAHNNRLLMRASELKGVDAIVLAQASMAGAASLVSEGMGIRVITSPASCIEEVAEAIG